MPQATTYAQSFAPPGRLFARRSLLLSAREQVEQALHDLDRARARVAELNALSERTLEPLGAVGLLSFWDLWRWDRTILDRAVRRETDMELRLASIASACSPDLRPFGAVVAHGKLVVDVREYVEGDACSPALILDVARVRNLDDPKGGR